MWMRCVINIGYLPIKLPPSPSPPPPTTFKWSRILLVSDLGDSWSVDFTDKLRELATQSTTTAFDIVDAPVDFTGSPGTLNASLARVMAKAQKAQAKILVLAIQNVYHYKEVLQAALRVGMLGSGYVVLCGRTDVLVAAQGLLPKAERYVLDAGMAIRAADMQLGTEASNEAAKRWGAVKDTPFLGKVRR
jgi:hypothetical protein